MASARGQQARVPMGPGGEFDLIRQFLGPDQELAPGVLLGPGDDCAVLEGGWVVSTDLSIEEVHFRRDWINLDEAGFRATCAALSDLAAMAAEPAGVLVSLAMDPRGFAAEGALLHQGVSEACVEAGVQILGGDLSRSPGPAFVNVVALGRSNTPVSRSGTKVGDELWVTGHLGGAAGAVVSWGRGEDPSDTLRECFTRPRPRIQEALWLAGKIDLHGLIDLSDGLAGDAGHLAAAGSVAIVLEASAIPVHPSLAGELEAPDEALRLALAGGEDFELAFSAPPGALDEWVDSFKDTFGLPLTKVGRAEAGEGVSLVGPDGGHMPLESHGFSHFPSEEEG